MIDILEWLGNCYALYRASQDAGFWIIQKDLEASLTTMLESLVPGKKND